MGTVLQDAVGNGKQATEPRQLWGWGPSLTVNWPWFTRPHRWSLKSLALGDMAHLPLAGGHGVGVFTDQLPFLHDLGGALWVPL